MLSLLVTTGADSGLGSLRQAIADAVPGETIVFAKKVQTITLTSGELQITKDLDIEGPGAKKLTISGSDASRIFDIGPDTSTVVTIAGLTIANGLADGYSPILHSVGGGILNQGQLTLENVVVSHNQAVGATDDTIFINQMALTGVGVGGGVANLGTLVVSDSTFTGNQARGASGSRNVGFNSWPGAGIGGGLANGGRLADEGGAAAIVTRCIFTSNLAQGGNRGDGTNSVPAIPGSAGGGAIGNYAFGTWESPGSADLSISGGTFSNNQAVGGNENQSATFPGKAIGGAISSHSLLLFGGTTSLEIRGATFSKNQAVGGNRNLFLEGNPSGGGADEAAGGAIFAFPTRTISRSTFVQNRAVGGRGLTDGGGAIDFNFPMDDVTLSNCTLRHNAAIGGPAGVGGNGGDAGGGGIAMYSPTTLTIMGSFLDHNVAQGGRANTGGPASHGGSAEGGGIDNAGGATTVVIGGTITHNQAIGAPGSRGGNGGHGWGGGVSNELGGTVSIMSTTVAHNMARGGGGRNGGDGWGGGLYNDASSTLTLTGATAEFNLALRGGQGAQGIGGGVYADPLGTFSHDPFTAIKKNHASKKSTNNIGP